MAPCAKDLRVSEEALNVEICKRLGVPVKDDLPVSRWPLHLKDVTLLDIEQLQALKTKGTKSKEFLKEALRYLNKSETFNLYYTSATIKGTALSKEDVQLAVAKGKFEPCADAKLPLPHTHHGVNLFTVNEVGKRRRRIISEPHLNSVVQKDELPKIERPSRLERRQRLRRAKYMFQIDFEAFYDAIPLPEDVRNNYIFLAHGSLYRLCTLHTGARWSVAVGQAVTDVITDIEQGVIIETMIDNVLVAAEEGQEEEFCAAVRNLRGRMRDVNLMTSPSGEEIDSLLLENRLLQEAMKPCVFLGEDYCWNGSERLVRNSAKTYAKIHLAYKAEIFTYRSFAALVSLMCYALHTTDINPARLFPIMAMFRVMYKAFARGKSWDDLVPYISAPVRNCIESLGDDLLDEKYYVIADPIKATYEDHDYDLIVYTDASRAGYGAIARWKNGNVRAFQRRWVHDIKTWKGQDNRIGRGVKAKFNARHSAHAEPDAAREVLRWILEREDSESVKRIALVTDHYPIVIAQRQENGFRGVGRGYYLNRLFRYTNDLLRDKGIRVVFFQVKGTLNPADGLSRNFGDNATEGRFMVESTPNTGIPSLVNTYCPLCVEKK